jgi:hypothetical protein
MCTPHLGSDLTMQVLVIGQYGTKILRFCRPNIFSHNLYVILVEVVAVLRSWTPKWRIHPLSPDKFYFWRV